MGLSDLALRRIATTDQAFLEGLYASTRAREMAQCPWPADAVARFLAEQFALQHQYYQSHYPDADYWLVGQAGAPIGRLYLYWAADELRLIDIALLPAFRGQGIGSALLDRQLGKADALGLPVTLHVEPDNPARRLYERRGFQAVDDNGLYLRMHRAPR